jgi:hypothetical protein
VSFQDETLSTCSRSSAENKDEGKKRSPVPVEVSRSAPAISQLNLPFSSRFADYLKGKSIDTERLIMRLLSRINYEPQFLFYKYFLNQFASADVN